MEQTLIEHQRHFIEVAMLILGIDQGRGYGG
jgi:hypothetical protein